MNEFYKVRKKRGVSKFNITLILVVINVACFILFGILLYAKPEFLDYIALKPSNIINNFYFWTFITSMFMHAGFFHLFVNMFSFLSIGSLIEKILGKRRYLWFYLVSGLFAGIFFVLASLVFPADFNTYAVGASGALFGIIGLTVMLIPNLPVYVMFIPVPIKMKYAAPGMLVLLWLISILGNVPIGNTAHLGGFVIGIAYGIFLRKKYKNKTQYVRRYFGG